jgi:hypothetical protein
MVEITTLYRKTMVFGRYIYNKSYIYINYIYIRTVNIILYNLECNISRVDGISTCMVYPLRTRFTYLAGHVAL